MANTEKVVVGIDLGGTFIDITVDRGDERQGFKVSGEAKPEDSFFRGIDELTQRGVTRTDELTRIIHGTTLTTNALLERKLAKTVLVTTVGFRDVLEIGRHSAPRSGNIQRWIKPQRPITRDHIVEVDERVSADGKVLRPLTREKLAQLAEDVQDADAIAIVLINAVANHEHENEIAKYLQKIYPDKKISKSYEVRGIAGEYERAMTTVINATLQPRLAEYLDNIQQGLRDRGVTCPVYLMGSDGGLVTFSEAQAFPVGTVMSGPAGGVQAASLGALLNKQDRIVTLDVGGTSSDIARAEKGEVGLTDQSDIGDFSMNIPIVEIATIGAGGGSIASVDDGRLRVGPESAGSNPGPVCYLRGGTEPTVTDAMLVVGRLPTQLAGGTLHLDITEAKRAVREKVADPLGLPVEEAALGIIKLANEKIAATLRQVSLDQGHDPRDYALMPYGGGGSLHAVEVAQSALLQHVLIPPQPGTFSAQGLLDAPITKHSVTPFPDLPELNEATIKNWRNVKKKMSASLQSWAAEDTGIVQFNVRDLLEVQYEQQGAPLLVEVPNVESDKEVAEAVRRLFEEQHVERYSYKLPERKVVIAAAHSQGIGQLSTQGGSPAFSEDGSDGEETSSRQVFTDHEGWVNAQIIKRSTLPKPGVCVRGPIIIEENTTTLFVPHFAQVEQLDNGYMKVAW